MSERDITITAGEVTISATLNDTATAAQIWDALPIEASASTWGDEIYFGIPVVAGEESDRRSSILATWDSGPRAMPSACSSVLLP